MLPPESSEPETPSPEGLEPTPILIATPEPVRDRRPLIAAIAGLVTLLGGVGIALALEGRAVVRDEENLWTIASSIEGTEQDWQRYADFADGVRSGGGLRSMLATELTSVWARAPLASENVLVARAQMAAMRGDDATLCAVASAAAGTRGGNRARMLEQRRAEERWAAYRAHTTDTPTRALDALATAMRAARDDDPCVTRVVMRLPRAIDADVALDRRLAGSGASLRSVIEESGAHDAETSATLSSELEGALGLTRTSDDDDAHLRVEVVHTVRPDEPLLTGRGTEMPTLSLDATVRFFVRPAHGLFPSAAAYEARVHVGLAESYALPMAEASSEAALRRVYANMLAELDAGLLASVRRELGLAHASARAPSGEECPDAQPLPLGRVIHGDTRHLLDAAMGSCSTEHEEEVQADDCDECWEEEDPPPSAEAVYRLVVTERSRVAIDARADDARTLVVYVRTSCDDAASELACDASGLVVDVLDPGVYDVFVDETGGGSGRFDLVASMHPVDREARACAAPSMLTSGVVFEGDTSGGTDELENACGGVGARDRVHAIDVPVPSRLRCAAGADFDATIDVRSACESIEIASEGVRRGALRAQLQAGRYFVTIDGETIDERGRYDLTCEVAPLAGTADLASDTVASATPIVAGVPSTLDTMRARDDLRASCATTDGPDLVYRVDVPTRSHLHASATSGSGTVLSLRASGSDTELGCAVVGALELDVDAGTYFLVVDSDATHFGVRTLDLSLTDLALVCAGASAATLGASADSTHGGTSLFRGTCAPGNGPEAVRRLTIAARSHVVVTLDATFDGALYLRRDCADWRSEVACQHTGGVRHAVLDETLDAGTYALVVDGARESAFGTYTLDVSVRPSE